MPNPSWACALCHLAPPDVARSRKKRDLCDLCEPGLAARGLAWCARGHRVAIDDMTAGRGSCKAHRREQRNRNTTEAQREAQREANRRYRARHRDRIRERRRTPEKRAHYRMLARRWRAANRERYNATQRAGRARNAGAYNEYYRKWREQHPERSRVYRQRCKLRILQSWKRAA